MKTLQIKLLRNTTLVYVFALFVSTVQAQDSTPVTKEHSPAKASVLSAILPGSGQFYNKKYWKVPLVYAAIGTSIYFAHDNGKKFKSYRNALKVRLDNDTNTVDLKYIGLSNQAVQQNMEFYRRQRDLSYIFIAVSYIINILDATVDAHLKGFDISEDISMRIKPTMMFDPNQRNINTGVSLAINF